MSGLARTGSGRCGPLRTRVLEAHALATLAALLLPVAACGQNGTEATTTRLAQESPATAAGDPSQLSQSVDASRQNAIVQAARGVSPAVVSILTLRTERYAPRSVWEGLFLGPENERLASGLGSGFIIDGGGVVLTNEHVVRGADSIMVTLPDGRDFRAELVGADRLTDIAVLRVQGSGLPVAPIGSSQGLIIGEWAVAIGNPFANFFSNPEPTVTAGVVSAVGRHIVPSSEEQGFYLGMIQTDASINPGNSGGPLVNALGQVIGVNSSIFSRSGGSEGLGFAIPIDRALRVAEDLLDHGEVRRAWLGFDVEPVEADVWGRTRGVRVARVAEGSPAARAGIRPGARLLEAGGHRLTAPLDFENVLMDLRADDEIVLGLESAGAPVRIRAEALPTVRAERVSALRNLDLITVTAAVRAERGIASEAGAMIASISPEMSAQFGLQPGDVLVRIGDIPIRTAEDAARVFRQIQGQRGILQIVVERGGLLPHEKLPVAGVTAEELDRYHHPLSERYASREMQQIFSPARRYGTWRRLWLALAEAEAELGLPMPDGAIEQMRAHLDHIDLAAAAEYERRFRHDVMAHVHLFADDAPAARGVLHVGATSAFIGDNTDLILHRDALVLVRRRLLSCIEALADFARRYRDLATLAWTHFQPAQPTTVGKRATLWIQDLLLDVEEIDFRLATLRFRGAKGTTGTQASFLELFEGDHDKVERLDELVTAKMGFAGRFAVTGQTYTRKLDAALQGTLAGVAASLSKLANDLRLLAHLREVEEPFEEEQIGSSAMPYKRNPMRAERICALTRHVIALVQDPLMTAATQWLERTLDDSANRRLSIPDAYLALDGALVLTENVVRGLTVNPDVVRKNLAEHLPFMATETILMQAVLRGGDRQALHERIRRHSLAAAGRMKEGVDGDLPERIAADGAFGISLQEVHSMIDPARFVGRAPEQVDRFLVEEVEPLLAEARGTGRPAAEVHV